MTILYFSLVAESAIAERSDFGVTLATISIVTTCCSRGVMVDVLLGDERVAGCAIAAGGYPDVAIGALAAREIISFVMSCDHVAAVALGTVGGLDRLRCRCGGGLGGSCSGRRHRRTGRCGAQG